MTAVKKLWPLLTATHRYDKSISTHGRGAGQMIDAPILAYLIETANGRILYDVGCDYNKINDPALCTQHYHAANINVPAMQEEQRIPHHLARLGLTPADIDVIFVGHLHFDHVGGLGELKRCGCGAEIHIQHDELEAARGGADAACFADDFIAHGPFDIRQGEYALCSGVSAISTPGHTAGHMSMWIELPKGKPVLLAGDAADLTENLDDEIAPGGCWRHQYDQAVDSIRKLKRLAHEEDAQVWPNHDFAFYRGLRAFPGWHE
ncbi:MAG: fold metallo-hydrolase [Herbaspirillum sp.]|nr:fold metallo-hydrolase [Herbaspirillum sp.]